MKKRFVLWTIAVMACVGCFAQDIQEYKVESVKVDTTDYSVEFIGTCGYDKAMLYRATMEWLTTHPDKHLDVLVKDANAGRIRMNCMSRLYSTKKMRGGGELEMKGHFYYVVTIDLRDNRFRLKGENVVADWDEWLYAAGRKSRIGLKKLSGKQFLLWSEDGKALSSYGSDIGAIADGIIKCADNLLNDDF